MANGSSVARDHWSNAVQPRLAFLDDILDSQRSQQRVSNGAQNAVDDELAALDAGASHIRFRRNSLAPVCRIPPEILAVIFELYILLFQLDITHVHRDPGSPRTLANSNIAWVVSLTHVCRHWRNVALGSPTLWNRVDVSTGLEWWTEMVSRSGTVPTTLDASDYASCDSYRFRSGPPRDKSGCVLKRLHKARVFPTHIHRTMDLHISGCVANVKATVATLATTPAPALQALTLRPSPRPGSGGFFPKPKGKYTMISETLFSGVAPSLRRISFENCYLPWTSPLLKNLTYLKMNSTNHDRGAHTGSFVDLLDALQTMSGLETLILLQILPRDHRDCTPADRPVCNLPALEKIHVADIAGACVALLSHINIPSCVDFDVDCTWCDGDGEYCCLVLPFLSAAIRRVQSSGKIIRSLSIQRIHEGLLATLYEKDYELDSHHHKTKPTVRIVFDESAMPDNHAESEDIIEKAIGLLAVDTLTTLDFDGWDWVEEQWHLFDRATEVFHIHTNNATGETIVPLLGRPYDSDASSHQRIFPHLRTLSLESVNLTQIVPEGEEDLGTILARNLDDRVDVMEKLVLRECELS
ncbi:hypothetical protein OF83DRAFT_202978, partial [Amylostereum chailletii]